MSVQYKLKKSQLRTRITQKRLKTEIEHQAPVGSANFCWPFFEALLFLERFFEPCFLEAFFEPFLLFFDFFRSPSAPAAATGGAPPGTAPWIGTSAAGACWDAATGDLKT